VRIQGLNSLAQYADWVTKGDVKDADELKPGQGGIISSGVKKIAAYRDEQNNLHTCSAVCPHLGAILQCMQKKNLLIVPHMVHVLLLKEK